VSCSTGTKQYYSFLCPSSFRSVPTLLNGEVQDIRNEYFALVRYISVIKLVFQLVTVFAMMVSFFSLNTSMYTNIMEQCKEVGVLRALGLKKFAVFRIYTYEAFVLVISSAILGVSKSSSCRVFCLFVCLFDRCCFVCVCV